jgi:short-subunit dehydrogenase
MADKNEFLQKYGPWAMVAGGSEGLGGAFSEELAGRGLNLVIISRRPGPLEETAARLRAAHGVQVRALRLDMADPKTLADVERETAGLEIGLLVCNAGTAYTGPFLKPEFDEYQRILDVNCRCSLGLIHAQARKMAARHKGGIVVMSSLAAFQGSPMVAVYGATKAFLVTLAEALADELKPHGVDVCACCPAVVLTPNFLNDGHDANGPTPMSLPPAYVAQAAIRDLGRKTIVIPGAMSRLAHFMMGRVMTRRTTVRILGRSTRAMYREKAQ